MKSKERSRFLVGVREKRVCVYVLGSWKLDSLINPYKVFHSPRVCVGLLKIVDSLNKSVTYQNNMGHLLFFNFNIQHGPSCYTSVFLTAQLIYLGHKITSEGFKPDSSKLEAIVKMPNSNNKKEEQCLLGMSNNLCRFMLNCSKITTPFSLSLQNDVELSFDQLQQKSMDYLKDQDTNQSELQFCNPFIIIIVIIIMSHHQHGYPWPSLATPPYRPLLPADDQGYIPNRHITAVCRFELVVQLFLVHVKGSTGLHHLWACPYFSSSVPHVWFV